VNGPIPSRTNPSVCHPEQFPSLLSTLDISPSVVLPPRTFLLQSAHFTCVTCYENKININVFAVCSVLQYAGLLLFFNLFIFVVCIRDDVLDGWWSCVPKQYTDYYTNSIAGVRSAILAFVVIHNLPLIIFKWSTVKNTFYTKLLLNLKNIELNFQDIHKS